MIQSCSKNLSKLWNNLTYAKLPNNLLTTIKHCTNTYFTCEFNKPAISLIPNVTGFWPPSVAFSCMENRFLETSTKSKKQFSLQVQFSSSITTCNTTANTTMQGLLFINAASVLPNLPKGKCNSFTFLSGMFFWIETFGKAGKIKNMSWDEMLLQLCRRRKTKGGTMFNLEIPG